MPTANDRQVGGNHYQQTIQPWDFIAQNDIGFLAGNVIKYTARYDKKSAGGIQDLKKAQHYLEKLIEVEELKMNTPKDPKAL